MATVIDITVNQIKSSMPPMPVPQTLPSKITVKRDAPKEINTAEKNKANEFQVKKEDVARMAEDIKSVVELLNTSISLSIEKRDFFPDIVVAKIIDKDTKDVIRQIPTEEIIEIGKRLDELVGIVFRQKT